MRRKTRKIGGTKKATRDLNRTRRRVFGGNGEMGVTWSDYVLMMPNNYDGIAEQDRIRMECIQKIFVSLPYEDRHGFVNFDYIDQVCPS